MKQRPPPQDGYGWHLQPRRVDWAQRQPAGLSTVVVYLPQKQTTLVVLINTDGEYQGGEASTALASAITK
ncbi:MAG: penicillin-binding protein beta-lactamase class [Mycobacterium sp.]|nr:penicillin-binding protein beta-lactamase class [Mycobacterium sp.]